MTPRARLVYVLLGAMLLSVGAVAAARAQDSGLKGLAEGLGFAASPPPPAPFVADTRPAGELPWIGAFAPPPEPSLAPPPQRRYNCRCSRPSSQRRTKDIKRCAWVFRPRPRRLRTSASASRGKGEEEIAVGFANARCGGAIGVVGSSWALGPRTGAKACRVHSSGSLRRCCSASPKPSCRAAFLLWIALAAGLVGIVDLAVRTGLLAEIVIFAVAAAISVAVGVVSTVARSTAPGRRWR